MSHLPSDWKSDRLKDVSAINAVSLPADTDPDYEFDYLEISNVDYHGIVDPNAIERIQYENAPSRARRRVPKNCTVISSVRPNLQAVAFLENGRKDFVCSTGFNVVQPAETKFSPKFAYYALISEGVRQYFEATAKGVGYPAVDDKDFHSFAVLLPPLSEQQCIAAYLDASCAAIDAAVAAKRRQIETLDGLRKVTIQTVITNGLKPAAKLKSMGIPLFETIPAHWGADRLRDIAAINSKSLSANTDPKYEFDYLEISNVNSHGIVDLSAIERICFEEAPSRARRCVTKNNTLISSVRPNLQAILFVSEHRPDFVCSTGFNVVQPNEAKLRPKFIYYALISDSGRQHFEATAKGVGYPAVDDKDFGAFIVPLPPLEEQEAICVYLDAKLGEIKRIITGIESQISTFTAYRKSLIHECVTGQRRITEADVARARRGREAK